MDRERQLDFDIFVRTNSAAHQSVLSLISVASGGDDNSLSEIQIRQGTAAELVKLVKELEGTISKMPGEEMALTLIILMKFI